MAHCGGIELLLFQAIRDSKQPKVSRDPLCKHRGRLICEQKPLATQITSCACWSSCAGRNYVHTAIERHGIPASDSDYDNEGRREVVADDTCVAGLLDGGVVDGGSDRFLAGKGRTSASND
jgi:hypothetical protein